MAITLDGTSGITTTSTEAFGIPSGTTEQRPTSPSSGYVRYNTTSDKTEIYNGTSWEFIESSKIVNASGGTETTIVDNGTNYKVHTFTSSGTFTVADGGKVEYLVIGGGASGRSNGKGKGGAGAGGYRCSVVGESSGRNSIAEQQINLTPGSYTVTIGAGGATNANGASTAFASITSLGGGTGGDYYSSGGNGTNNAGSSGGCGGGGGGVQNNTVGAGGAGTVGQGFDGGNGAVYFSYPPGGGGGGAGEAGGDAVNNVGAGDGGDGISSSIDGIATYRAGGGGAYGWNGVGAGSPGLGGAGATNVDGSANTGGGGGGGNGTSGGSGVVIIRYRV